MCERYIYICTQLLYECIYACIIKINEKKMFKSLKITKWNFSRKLSSIAGNNVSIKELQLKQYANSTDLSECLQLASHSFQETKLQSKQVFIRLLASPINPADINIIQGNLYFSIRFIILLYNLKRFKLK